MSVSEHSLAVIVYDEGEGSRVDDVLEEVARSLRRAGNRLAGAVQHNTEAGDRCRCDMTLEDLATGRRIDISEKRGPEARGCRLDSFALEDMVGRVTASLSMDAQLLIVNRFGKREAAGHGFRSAIESAIEMGLPVLSAVSRANLPAWAGFTASMDERLPVDIAAVLAWCERNLRHAERLVATSQ